MSADVIELETKRLTLRQWRDGDLPRFAAMSADPMVMAHFPSTLTREQSDAFANAMRQRIARDGWGFWAVELRRTGAFCGFVGLNRPQYRLPFSPCTELGWRLAQRCWGRGIAVEAALAAIAFAFEQLALREVVAFTAVGNRNSLRVMEKLGMDPEPEPFRHPRLAPGHRLSWHRLYRLRRDDYLTSTSMKANS